MADSGITGISKAAKKNMKKALAKKRSAALKKHEEYLKKSEEEGLLTPEYLKELLNQKLEIAREDGDHDAMKNIRKEIWVVNDMIAGVKTDIPEKELRKILESLPIAEALKDQPSTGSERPSASQPTKAKKESTKLEKKESTPTNGVDLSKKTDSNPESQDPQKKLRNLKKKLNQIIKIKEKIANKETVEKSQIEKVKSEQAVLTEIEDLELDIAGMDLQR